jgi:ABC-type multidrug transport system permease subunit
LTFGISQDIQTSTTIPQDIKPALTESVHQGVQLASDEAIQTALETNGVDATVEQELMTIYNLARTKAFKAGVSLLVFLAIVGTVLSFMLPKRKLLST